MANPVSICARQLVRADRVGILVFACSAEGTLGFARSTRSRGLGPLTPACTIVGVSTLVTPSNIFDAHVNFFDGVK